jgi:peptide/nickel transport system substrate-binding protein
LHKSIVALVAALASAAVVSSGAVGSAAASSGGGTLTIGWPTYPPGFDPQRITSIDNSNSMMYATLVDFNSQGKVVPYLATKWSTSEGGKVWTFYLRHGVTFPSGAKLTSSVVKETFERAMAKSTTDVIASDFFGPIKTINTPNPYEIQFVFSTPYAPFLSILTTAYAAPLDPVALKKYGLNFGDHPSGAGPFEFESTVADESITYVRNPSFDWGPAYWSNTGPADVQKIEFETITDPETALLAFEKGELDILSEVPPQDVSILAKRPGTKLYYTNEQGLDYLGFNCSKWPFNNILVRKAVAMMVQRTPIIDAAFNHLATPVYAGLPPTIPGFSSAVNSYAAEQYPYSPKEARALLAKAGFKMGSGGVLEQDGKAFDVSLWTPNTSSYEEASEIIEQQLAPFGIKVSIQVHDIASDLAGTQKGLDNMLMLDYGWMDPQILEFEFGGNSLRMHYTNATIQSELNKANEISNVAARYAAYAVIQKQLVQAEPWVPLDVEKEVTAVQNVTGFAINSFDGGYELLDGVRLK